MKKRVSLVGTILMAGAAWLLLNAFTVTPAMAATGEVTWTNPPGNKGRIKRKDDDDSGEYEYNTNAGDTNPPGTKFQVGDRVTFTEGPGRTASNVTLDEDPGIPDDPAGGDPAKRSAIGPATASLGLLAFAGLYGVRRRRLGVTSDSHRQE